MHFRPGAWRKKFASATQRRWQVILSVIEAGLARSAIEWRAAPTEIRRRTAAHSAIESGHAALQLFINLLELVDPLQLIDRDTEAAQHAHQKKREPNLQAP